MTQPAKVQEPSMEEILASIRRIIADDEAKPAAKPEVVVAAPVPAPPPKPVMKDIPPSTIAPPPKPVSAPKPVAPPAPPPAAAPASNNQDDIDAMLASLDAATPQAEIRPAPPQPEPEPDVFELTDDMALAEPPKSSRPASFSRIEPDDDIEFSEGRKTAQEPQHEPAPQNPMLSRNTVSAVESAFNSLANTVLSNNARTLEDLVKEMLRPMLKSWLDDNLPGLVERIVKAEIERVSRGR